MTKDTKKTEDTKVAKKEPKKFPSMADEDLKVVARDILEQKIFTSNHIREYDMHMLGSIFIPMIFGGADQIDLEDLGIIYEYYDEAGPSSINGYPIFFSCRMMSKADSKRMWAYHEKLKEMRDNMLAYVKLDDKQPEASEASEKKPLSS